MGSVSWAAKYKTAPVPAYKISKAALHMLSAQYALDHADAGFTFLCVSPGVTTPLEWPQKRYTNSLQWLKTELGGDYAQFDVGVGVSELKRIILQATKAQNGKFVNIHIPGQEKSWGQYDGREIPW